MDFQEKYNKFKQELRDLKTAHDMRSNMRTFFETATIPQTSSFTATTIRVSYADGTQPIITTIVGPYELIPIEPIGNTQDFIYAESYGSSTSEQKIYILSTRKIENIQIIYS